MTTETEVAIAAMEQLDARLKEDDSLERVDLVARRTFSAEISAGTGRTVDLRIVPYGERIKANDGLGGVPRGVVYTEEFSPGVFDHQVSAAHRVLVDVEHEAGIAGVVGHGVALRSANDGTYGSFRLHETPAGETALTLVKEGVLAGASVECLFLKSLRTAEGVVKRVKAQLDRVALCRDPAYTGAVVLGVRTGEPAPIVDEEWLPVPFDQDLALRISALGITLPDRLVEHPAPDTSAATDTSEPTPSTGAE